MGLQPGIIQAETAQLLAAATLGGEELQNVGMYYIPKFKSLRGAGCADPPTGTRKAGSMQPTEMLSSLILHLLRSNYVYIFDKKYGEK